MTSINSEPTESSRPRSGQTSGSDQNCAECSHLDLLGGQPLDGSGFEEEIPDTDFQWRD
jgi:hypothetical protein